MTADRPVFVIKLRPEPGVDAVRALRALLKSSLRHFGLRCVSLAAEQTPMSSNTSEGVR